MSENIYESDKMVVTAFDDGEKRGRCLQFTPCETKDKFGNSYASLTKNEIKDLIKAIEEWMT